MWLKPRTSGELSKILFIQLIKLDKINMHIINDYKYNTSDPISFKAA